MSESSRRNGPHRKFGRLIADVSLMRTVLRVGLCLVLLVGGAVACSESGNASPDSDASESLGDSWVERAAGQRSDDSQLFAGYTEDEIGTEILVGEKLARRHTLARYRTFEEADLADVAANDVSSMSPEARDRAYFEQAVRWLLLGADDAMPTEVSDASDELWHAFYRSLDLCVERSEWPEAELYYTVEDGGYMSVMYPEFQSYLQQDEMTLDEFIDFKHECHKFAVTYPALDREHRDELVRAKREYYLKVLRLWMRDNPEMVVPMTYEQSMNHPYQDYVREICRTTDDPQECARSEGVTLP